MAGGLVFFAPPCRSLQWIWYATEKATDNTNSVTGQNICEFLHRISSWKMGHKSVPPTFWTERYGTPTFQDEKMKNLLSPAINRGDLQRLNYNKTLFLAGALPEPHWESSWRSLRPSTTLVSGTKWCLVLLLNIGTPTFRPKLRPWACDTDGIRSNRITFYFFGSNTVGQESLPCDRPGMRHREVRQYHGSRSLRLTGKSDSPSVPAPPVV